MFSLSTFEHQLVMYVTADDKGTFAKAFDLSTIPIVTQEQALAEERTKKLTTATPTLKAPSTGPKISEANAGTDSIASATAAAEKYAQQLMQIPELKAYGPILKSCRRADLTESETEYVVSVVKHIFRVHIVLQYEVKNTLPDTVLQDVSVLATPSEEDGVLQEDFIIPAPKLATNEPGTIYVAFKRLGGEHSFPVTSFTNILKFTSKEIDPTTGEPDETGYEDEYQVEDLELAGSDYVIPAFAGSFDHVWEQTGANGEEASETVRLTAMKSIAGMLHHPIDYLPHAYANYIVTDHLRNNLDTTEQVTRALSLQPLDGTDVTLSTSTHTLKMYGKTITGGRVAAMVKMAYSAKTGATTKITVRSEEEGVSALVVGSVA